MSSFQKMNMRAREFEHLLLTDPGSTDITLLQAATCKARARSNHGWHSQTRQDGAAQQSPILLTRDQARCVLLEMFGMSSWFLERMHVFRNQDVCKLTGCMLRAYSA